MRSQSHRSLPALGSALRVLNATPELCTTSWGKSLVRALETSPHLVVRDRIELSDFR
jgi:hypothetical protein